MDFNERLIEEVRKYHCIYDLSLKEYRNVNLKETIWEEIGKTLNESAETCRRRWKTLRDTRQKCKRTNALASGSGAPPPNKKWKYFDSLSFLDCKHQRQTTTNVEEDEETQRSDSSEYILDESFLNSTMTENYEEQIDNYSNNNNEFQSPHSSSQSTGRAGKRRADAELRGTFADTMEKCVASVSELAKMPQKNATMSLFESFAQKIIDANLPQSDVNRIEARIMLVLHEELDKCYPQIYI